MKADQMPKKTFQVISETDLTEERVRLAAHRGCQVEVEIHSEILMPPGGTGCLRRYNEPEP